MIIDHLAISYDNKLFIPVDVPIDCNCLFRALVESSIIPISDSKTFRFDLSNRTKILLIMDQRMDIKVVIISTSMKSQMKVKQLSIIRTV